MVEEGGQRPADVWIPNYKEHLGVALDIAVTCPIRGTFKQNLQAAEKYAQEVKVKKYFAGFEGTNKKYVPVVFDTFGGVSSEGGAIVREIFSLHYERKREFSVNKLWSKMLHILFSYNIRMILKRVIDGEL